MCINVLFYVFFCLLKILTLNFFKKLTCEEYNPYWQKSITEQYTSLSNSLPGSELVPVGPAWQRARELRATLPLYDADQSHPSALGQYLTACVFYGVFMKKSPLGLPNRLTCEDQMGEKIYLNIQAETGRCEMFFFFFFLGGGWRLFCWIFVGVFSFQTKTNNQHEG